MIRQLWHFALDVLGVHHFLSCFQELQQLVTNCHSIRINKTYQDDLILMLCFLDIAKLLMTTHVYQSNSCPFGLRGYSGEGFAWCFEIPEEFCFQALNNLLEYIASIISP